MLKGNNEYCPIITNLKLSLLAFSYLVAQKQALVSWQQTLFSWQLAHKSLLLCFFVFCHLLLFVVEKFRLEKSDIFEVKVGTYHLEIDIFLLHINR